MQTNSPKNNNSANRSYSEYSEEYFLSDCLAVKSDSVLTACLCRYYL